MAPTTPIVPLLSLEVENRPRHVIAIDGVNYTLRRSDDLSIEASRELAVQLKTFGQISDLARQPKALARATRAQLDKVLRDLCALILAAPPAVLKKITPVQRFRIVNVFLMLSLKNRLSSTKALESMGQIQDRAIDALLTGKTSSPNSSGSSAATRSPGSRRTRSRSSASISGS